MRNATLYPYFLKKSQWGWGGKKEGGGGKGGIIRGRCLFEVMALGVGTYKGEGAN